MRTLAGIPKNIVAVAVDTAVGLGLFCLIVTLVGVEPAGPAVAPLSDLVAISANAAEIAKLPDDPAGAARAADAVKSAVPVTNDASSLLRFTDQRTAMWMLAAIFSALFAFNLTFLRHLRRQYVPVRRRPRRRGRF